MITFATIRGHQRACDLLKSAVAHDRLPHAMLFAGPGGIGKHTVALALAAALHCEQPGAEACGTCAACHQLAAGSHPDLQLVGIASGKKEIGIDRIRGLKRFTQLQPARGKLKIGIVDDAQMLTLAAQNALLKTLEEPPEHSLLILVANNPDALLPTVRSRCQRLQFFPLAPALVADVLSTDLGMESEAAGDLAAVADGSIGRAVALNRSLAGTRSSQLAEQLAALNQGRYVQLMELANTLARPEADSGMKLELLLSQFRDAAVASVEAGDAGALRVALQRASVVTDALEALRRSNPNRQLLLEALAIRLTRTA